MTREAIRTFQAPTMREALAKVRETLGDDAIILHTRQTSVRGLLGKATPVVEISASEGKPKAVDAQNEMRPPAKPSAPVARPSATTTSTSSLEDQVRRLQRIVDRLSGVQVAPHSRPVVADEGALESYLRALELGETLVRECLEVARHECPGVHDPYTPELMSKLVDYLAGRFRTRPIAETDNGAPRAIALLGPTGVGKTTTLAKLAARFVVEDERPVTLVTMDGYRIGAAEEIKRYGELLGVKTYHAKSATELRLFLDREPAGNLVLVDTPGRSPVESAEINELMNQLEPVTRRVLVLSATARESAVRAALDAFRPLHYERLILTKLDETPGTGAIATIASIAPVAVCGVCFGQSIRHDWQEASSTRLAQWALGEAARAPVDPLLVVA